MSDAITPKVQKPKESTRVDLICSECGNKQRVVAPRGVQLTKKVIDEHVSCNKCSKRGTLKSLDSKTDEYNFIKFVNPEEQDDKENVDKSVN